MRVAVPGGELVGQAVGSGPPVVLIHGTAPAIWGELPALLRERNRVVTYDRRSFGASRGDRPRDLTAHAEDAAALLRECGPPATIVGWSIGGVVALEVAAAHPDLVDGLVLLEPPLHAKRHPRPAMIAAIAGATLRGKLGRPEAGARSFGRWALGRRDGGDDLDAMPAEFQARIADDAQAIVHELASGTGEHLDGERLSTIDTPVRVLRGDRSQTVFADAARRVADAIPSAALIDVAGSGHAVQLDAPEVVAESVAAVRCAAEAEPDELTDPGGSHTHDHFVPRRVNGVPGGA